MLYDSKGNIPILRKSSHTKFSSYSWPGFWYVTLFQLNVQRMVWPVKFCMVWNRMQKKLMCLSRFGLGLEVEFLAVSIGLSRHAYSKNSALEKDLRTPQVSSHSTQVSSHSPHILRNHRTPERASHTIKSSYSGGERDFTFFPPRQVFFFLFFIFQLKCPGITFFGIWGRWRSHLKRLKFHIRSHSM